MAGIVKRRGGPVQISRAGQADKPVSQVLPVEKNEHNHEQDDAELGHRMYQDRNCRYDRIERAKIGFADFNGNWFVRIWVCQSGRLWLLKLCLQVLQHVGRLLDGAPA